MDLDFFIRCELADQQRRAQADPLSTWIVPTIQDYRDHLASKGLVANDAIGGLYRGYYLQNLLCGGILSLDQLGALATPSPPQNVDHKGASSRSTADTLAAVSPPGTDSHVPCSTTTKSNMTSSLRHSRPLSARLDAGSMKPTRSSWLSMLNWARRISDLHHHHHQNSGNNLDIKWPGLWSELVLDDHSTSYGCLFILYSLYISIYEYIMYHSFRLLLRIVARQ